MQFVTSFGLWCGLFSMSLCTAGAQEVQTQPLLADRPGFSTPPDLLSPGTLQFEGGFTVNLADTQGTLDRTVAYGTPLVRFGISSLVELQLGGDGVRWHAHSTQLGADRFYGLSDFSVGAKLKLRGESRLGPALALVPSLSLPVGNQAFTSSGYDPTFKLAWSKNLPGHFSAGGNFNFSSLTDSTGRIFQKAASLSVSHGLFAGLGGYWEVYSISPFERGAGATWIFSTGATHALGKNAQVDLELGRALTSACPGWFVASGFVVRNPFSFLRHPQPRPAKGAS